MNREQYNTLLFRVSNRYDKAAANGNTRPERLENGARLNRLFNHFSYR